MELISTIFLQQIDVCTLHSFDTICTFTYIFNGGCKRRGNLAKLRGIYQIMKEKFYDKGVIRLPWEYLKMNVLVSKNHYNIVLNMVIYTLFIPKAKLQI